MDNPAATEPPGELIYKLISLSGFSDSRKSSCATTRFAIWSSILPTTNITHAWYKFYFYINPKLLKSDWSRDRILQEINNSGYLSFTGSCSEIFKEKCFRTYDLDKFKDLQIAKELGDTSIMLLVHPTITNDQINNYGELTKKIIKKATR